MIKKYIEKYRNLNSNIKASLWFVICSFFVKGISVITTPIFTRLLNTSEYGQYNVFTSWMGIITVFITLSIFNGVYSQGLIKFDGDKKFSSSMQGLTFSLIVIWGVIYYCSSSFWNGLFSLTTVQMTLMLISIWSTSVFSFWAAEQRVELKYKGLVIVTIIVSIVKPVLCILLVYYSEDKVTARIFGIAIVELLAYSWMFIKHQIKGKKFFDFAYWKYALILCIPLIPHYLAQNILVNSDRIMIERMIGDSESGIYSLSYSLAQLTLLFGTALTQSISPWIMKKIKENRVNNIAKIVNSSIIIVSSVTLLLIVAAPEITRLFAPSSYSGAIFGIPPIAISVLFQFAYGVLASIEFYFEKTKLIALSTIFSAGLNVFLNYLLIPQFGYLAAAYTTLFCYIVLFLCHFLVVRYIYKKQNFDTDICNTKIMLAILFSSTIVGLCLLATYDLPIIRYSVLGTILIVAFLLRKKIILLFKQIFSKKENIGTSNE